MIDFVKAEFEKAKSVSHLSETIVIDVKTAEWLIDEVERSKELIERFEIEAATLKNYAITLRRKGERNMADYQESKADGLLEAAKIIKRDF